MKHNLNICVSKEPKTGGVVSCRNVTLREKLLTRLFGKQEKVMILIPGNTVETLSITELSEGGGSLEYLINGNMLPMKNAGAFADTTTSNDGKEDSENEQEVLEVEESDGTGNGTNGEDAVSERHNRRRKLV